VHAHGRAPATEAAALGHRLAAELIGKGAADILAEAQHTPGAVQGLQP